MIFQENLVKEHVKVFKVQNILTNLCNPIISTKPLEINASVVLGRF